MKDMLSDMGMPIAFNQDKATFKLFDQPLSTWIDEIYHQAVVIVDEKGTEAAAATGIVVSTDLPLLHHLFLKPITRFFL